MNTPDANLTRASLEDARVALGPMLGAATAGASAPSKTMASRARDAWESVESMLHVLTGRGDLYGQDLLAEARRTNALDMEAMHALVAMREWTDRTMAPGSAAQKLSLPPTDAEREVARNVLSALERAVGGGASPFSAQPSAVPAPPLPSAPSPWAPQPTNTSPSREAAVPSQWAPPSTGAREANYAPPRVAASHAAALHADAPHADAPAATYAQNNVSSMPRPVRERSRFGATFAVAIMVAGLVAGAIYFVAGRGNPDNANLTEQGVAAYARGSKETARLAFTGATERDPNDARALTYLGRIAREQGDLVKSRQFLERAIRAQPNNALALRELGAALLAAKEFELARRFYVRSLEVDPNDKVSQGFLGCALNNLQRFDEATRWFARAGQGEWSSCDTRAATAPPRNN